MYFRPAGVKPVQNYIKTVGLKSRETYATMNVRQISIELPKILVLAIALLERSILDLKVFLSSYAGKLLASVTVALCKLAWELLCD